MENEKKGIQLVKIKMVDDAFLDLGENVSNKKSAYEEAMKRIAMEVGSFDREVLLALNLNTKNRVINANIITMGTINSTMFAPRDIFKSAILSNATRIVLFHNHPSGDLTPSLADMEATQRIVKAGELLGIEVVDHVIANQKGEMLSVFEEAPFHGIIFEEAEKFTVNEGQEKPNNLEKFQILSRRKDYLKEEKLNLELEAISYLDTSKVDSEIKKIDEVINGFLSKEQKEHIIEFLKTQGEGNIYGQKKVILTGMTYTMEEFL